MVVLVFKIDDGRFERIDGRIDGDLHIVFRLGDLLFVEEVTKACDVLILFACGGDCRLVARDGVIAALEEVDLRVLEIDGAVDEAVFDELVGVRIGIAVGLDVEIAHVHEACDKVALDNFGGLDRVFISGVFAACGEIFALRDVDFGDHLPIVLLDIGGHEVAACERAERHDCRDAYCRRFFLAECHKILCSEPLLFFSGAYIAPHTCLLYLIFA